MCWAYWSYNTHCCNCATKCKMAFESGRVLTQQEILQINSGGAADCDEMNTAHRNANETFRGYS